MDNTVRRKIDPNSPVHIPIVLNGIAILLGAIVWIYTLPDNQIPMKNLLKP
jgi:hypothetical protein